MKYLFFFLVIIMCLSCTKQPNEPTDLTNQNNVNITLDYAFPVHSGDMVTKGESTYLDFYNDYILSKILTPKTYSLQFVGPFNNWSINQNVTGQWGSKSLISLPPGKYIVQGGSGSTPPLICSDTCFFTFNDTIEITQTSTNLILKAHYGCSLILLDTADVKSTKIEANPEYKIIPTMMKIGGFYHTFIGNVNNVYPAPNFSITVTHRSMEPIQNSGPYGPFYQNKSTIILLYLYTLEIGKYYYFENTSNGYTIVPMVNGDNG
jgi:hypothetical protein